MMPQPSYRLQQTKLIPILSLEKDDRAPDLARYAYRSFDRQFLFCDARLLDRPGPALWNACSDKQVYLTSLFSQVLGSGPALTSSAQIPDLDHFRGSYGAKAVIPLYRTALTHRRRTSCLACLILLGRSLSTDRSHTRGPYSIRLRRPGPTSLHLALSPKELESRELRVPITRDAELFESVRAAGAHLLWLHTYGERFVPEGKPRGQIPARRGQMHRSRPRRRRRLSPKTFAYNDDDQEHFTSAPASSPLLSLRYCTAFERVRTEGRAVVARLPNEVPQKERSGASKPTPLRQHTTHPLDQPVHHRTARTPLGPRSDPGRLSRSGPTPPGSHRR